LKSDQSLVFEDVEVDFGTFPGGELRADPGDVDVGASGVGDEVEPVPLSCHVYQHFSSFLKVRKGKGRKKTHDSSPHLVTIQSSKIPPSSFNNTLKLLPYASLSL
jgi:hypothetical protein